MAGAITVARGSRPNPLLGRGQSRHGAGHAGREVPRHAPVGRLAVGIEVHVARGARGRGLAVVERVHLPVAEPDHHESAAAEVAGLGMHHGEREANGHGRIDRVSPLAQDVPAHLARDAAARDHHRVGPLGHPGAPGERPIGRGARGRLRGAGRGGGAAGGRGQRECNKERMQAHTNLDHGKGTAAGRLPPATHGL
jgi:hypothetical protein